MAVVEDGAEPGGPSRQAIAGKLGWSAEKMTEFLSVYRQKDGPDGPTTEHGTPYVKCGVIGYDEATLWSELACDIQHRIESMPAMERAVIVWRDRPKSEPYTSERFRAGKMRMVSARFAVEMADAQPVD